MDPTPEMKCDVSGSEDDEYSKLFQMHYRTAASWAHPTIAFYYVHDGKSYFLFLSQKDKNVHERTGVKSGGTRSRPTIHMTYAALGQ